MLQSIDSQIAYLEARLEKAREQQERIAALPDFEAFPDESVLFFRMQFQEGGQSYTYAMIKCNGLWYTTGPRSPKAYTSDTILEWFSQHNAYDIWEAVEWERLD